MKRKINTKFFCYNQNNSGGFFKKPAAYVVIEAQNAKEADRIAEGIGIYFNGVDSEDDCECCGDRWYKAHDSSGTDTPMIYGESLEVFLEHNRNGLHKGRTPTLFIKYYHDKEQTFE